MPGPIALRELPINAMNLIAKLLAESNVIIDLDVSSKKRVFEQVGLLFENNNNIARSDVFDSLFAREKLGSTGLGQGIAIPHGRIKGLKEAVGAVVRTRQPIPFDAPDAPEREHHIRAARSGSRDRHALADPLGARADVQRETVPRATARRADGSRAASADHAMATPCHNSA